MITLTKCTTNALIPLTYVMTVDLLHFRFTYVCPFPGQVGEGW